MQNTINKVAQEWLSTDTGKEVVDEFYRLKREKGWRFMQGFVIELGNSLSNEVLSRKFQKQDDKTKLVKLEAYSMVSDVLKFFADPTVTFGKIQKMKQHNKVYGEAPAKARKRRQEELAGRS